MHFDTPNPIFFSLRFLFFHLHLQETLLSNHFLFCFVSVFSSHGLVLVFHLTFLLFISVFLFDFGGRGCGCVAVGVAAWSALVWVCGWVRVWRADGCGPPT